MNPKCIILVGLPGSGKSSVRKILPNYPVISSDDYIESYAKENGLTYRQAIAICLQDARRNNDDRFSKFIKDGQSFIIDRTNLSLEKRYNIYDKLPYHYDIEIVVVHRSQVNRMFVNMKRTLKGRNVPLEEIRELEQSFVRPSYNEDYRIISIKDIFK